MKHPHLLNIPEDVFDALCRDSTRKLRDAGLLPSGAYHVTMRLEGWTIECCTRYPAVTPAEPYDPYVRSEELIGLLGRSIHRSLLRYVESKDPALASVKDFTFAAKIVTALQKEGVQKIFDIVRIPEKNLKRYPRIGTKAISLIKKWLESFGLSLGMRIDESLRP